MKTISALGLVVLLATGLFQSNALANADDCSPQAISAAENYALTNEDVYHCVADPSVHEAEGVFSVDLHCVGETGSQSSTVKVTFANPETCAGPSVSSLF